MNIIASLLLSLALCVDSFVVSTTCAVKSKMSYRRGLLVALFFALFQGGFPLIGALIGEGFQNVISSIDHWVAFILLFLVGGKMILDAIKNDGEEESFDVSRIGVIVTLAIATSIDAFVVGIGFGLNSSLNQIFTTVVMIALVTFIASMAGIFVGKRNLPFPDRVATVIGGLVLIGLGTSTLIEHLAGA